MRSGIYKIINLSNGKFYVGSSCSMNLRKNRHWNDLNKNRHSNQHLQNAWNKYGKENFVFETIELCEKEILINREQFWIDLLKPQYNKRKIAENNIGNRHSEEWKINHSIRMKGINNPNFGKKFSEEHKKKLSEAHLGKSTWNKGLPKELQPRFRKSLEASK